MKRLLFISIMLLGIGQTPSFAQGGNDDIYFNSSDLEEQKKEDRQMAEQARLENERYESEYSRQGNDDGDYQTYNKSYDNDGYIDYENDDYAYATRLRRFNQPFYNMGYYSAFYNPFWYDPFWVDPYWGWSPWARPGISVMIGGGPYWSSFWGWHSWWGYGGFGSCWNYPMYGNWFGSPYYSGYWNGYYAGLWGGGYGYGGGYSRRVTYGPRNSTNFAYNTGFRGNAGVVRREATGQDLGLRTANNTRGLEMEQRTPRSRNMSSAPERGVRSVDRNAVQERSAGERSTVINRGNSEENGTTDGRPAAERPSRGQFSREDADNYNNRSYERSDRPSYNNGRSYERQQPRATERQQMQQRSYEPPRQQRSYERSAPSMERSRPAPSMERSRPASSFQRSGGSFTPSRSMPSSPSRGSSGGGMGGGRRR